MDFGSVTQTPFATYDPGSSSWRTWEPSLFEDSTSFSGRWPKSGTTLDGRAYELPSSALPTNATGCSSSVSLGTPSARAAKGANSVRVASGDTRGLLENQVATLPTPQARDGNHGGPQGKRFLNPERSNALALIPTPVVNDMGVNKTVEWWDEWVAEKKAQHGNGNGHGNSLAIEVLRLTGAATPLPSGDGSPSPDRPPAP